MAKKSGGMGLSLLALVAFAAVAWIQSAEAAQIKKLEAESKKKVSPLGI